MSILHESIQGFEEGPSTAQLSLVPSNSFDFIPYPGYVAEIVPRTDERVETAVQLEKSMLAALGDQDFEDDIDNSRYQSGFILLTSFDERDTILGSIRFMLAKSSPNKTFLEVANNSDMTVEQAESLLTEQSSTYNVSGEVFEVDRCKGANMTIDATALSPSMEEPAKIAELSDVLLATSRIVGEVLYEVGDRTHVTGYLHGIFLRHASKIGYPFKRLERDDGGRIPNYKAAKSNFTPVHTSLEVYRQLMNNAEPGSHLEIVKNQYDALSDVALFCIANAMKLSAKT